MSGGGEQFGEWLGEAFGKSGRERPFFPSHPAVSPSFPQDFPRHRISQTIDRKRVREFFALFTDHKKRKRDFFIFFSSFHCLPHSTRLWNLFAR